ncbi:MAG: glycosyltransferase family 2 protein [Acidobacteria bacterium]|nr:glycosyltransferase family 2 protein [Acidobacteriota bacterium]
MLKFSFSLPTYNAERYLAECLRSIRDQDYPRERVEILVADGGSSDGTLQIARRYGARIFPNPRKLADFGAKINVKNASGDLLVIFAADNGLKGRDWLQRASRQFEGDSKLAALWGKLVSGDQDPPINKYYELIQSDPINHFLNKNLKHYFRSARHDPAADCYTFDVTPEKPLVWGANGLVYRMDLVRDAILQEGFFGDNDVFQDLIEKGHTRVGYIPSLQTYHHTVTSLREWSAKMARNYRYHLASNYRTRNMRWVFNRSFKWKLALWALYSGIPVVSMAHALYLALRERNRYWLYHPVVSFVQTAIYAYYTLRERAARKMFVETVRVQDRERPG